MLFTVILIFWNEKRMKNIKILNKLPDDFQRDIKKAIEILKDAGCTEIFLFGSLALGKTHNNSDIDIAIRGCPAKLYFKILGKLLVDLDHSMDLIDLDDKDRFGNFLIENGDLVRVA